MLSTAKQMLSKAINIIARWPRAERSAVGAFVTAVTFYFGAFLSTSISNASAAAGTHGLAIHAAVFVVLLFGIVFLGRLVIRQLESYEHERELQKTTISRACSLCDKILTERSSRLEADENVGSKLLNQLGRTTKNIQGFIDAAYSTFESTYGKSSSSDERIDFEVTFMTKSFVDEKITIPAAANRDGRQPRSMILRKEKTDIYSNTVTANVYEMPSPHMVIVEDTSSTEMPYHELYKNQTDRIKSSIVYPVFSNMNRLLGTMVVHCDRRGFFTPDRKKYWSDLLEVFTKKIAYEVIKIEAMHSLAKGKDVLDVSAEYRPPY